MIETTTRQFPLHKHQAKALSERDLLNYLSVFPIHKITLTDFSFNQFRSNHYFSDHLHIQIVWKKALNHLQFTASLSIEDLVNCEMNGLLRMLEANILVYSRSNSYSSSEDTTLFYQKFQHCFPDVASEYLVEQPTALPDFFFTELLEASKNMLEFHQYLKNRELN